MGNVGGARTGRCLRLWRTAVTAAFGHGERERGKGENGHGRVRGKRGGAWRRAGDPGDEREKQEVAEDVAAACVVPGFSPAYWQEVEDGAAPGGLGRQVGWPAGPPGKNR